jgi:hypothetical protein
LVAAALGTALGVCLTLLSHRSISHVTPENPLKGVALVGLFMAGRFVIAVAALAAYGLFVRSGLVPFGLALTLSFVVGLGYEAFTGSGTGAPRTAA